MPDSKQEAKLCHYYIKSPPPETVKANIVETFEQYLEVLRKSLKTNKITFRLVGKDGIVYFVASFPKEFETSFLNILFGHFPGCEIDKLKNHFIQAKKVNEVRELTIKRDSITPILTYEHIDGDSLSSVSTFLAELRRGSVGWIGLTYAPTKENFFYLRSRKIKYRFFKLLRLLRIRDRGKAGLFEKESIGIEEKLKVHPVKCAIEIGLTSNYENSDLDSFENLIYSFYGTEYTNRLVKIKEYKKEKLDDFLDTIKINFPVIFSIKEAATLMHLPSQKEVPSFSAVISRKTEPPPNLPCEEDNENICFMGETNYHNNYRPFGIIRNDRRRHLYVIGKSGSGKSKLLELLIKDDLKNGHGFCVIDPHGDLVEGAINLAPKERINDIIIFDPTADSIVPFNPLENVQEDMRMQVTNSFVSVFKKAFASDWNPRLEHVLRYSVFALLETEDATVFSIQQLLTNRDYRQKVIRQIKNESVKNFWTNEFPSWTEKYNAEAINPLLNKIGQLVSATMIRNVISVPKNTFNVRKVMDEGKILLVKLPKGILGEENIQLLGAMFITKIYQAAMSRQDTPEEERRDFYLYVDEFQNFATDTFSEILSEARKYRLNLTIAHQFLGQLTEGIKKTVFGNVGSLISFRVGGEDAKHFVKEYTPMFIERDLINLGVREFYAKMSIDGEIRKAFSGRTLFLHKPEHQYQTEIHEASHKNFAVDLDKIKTEQAKKALIDTGTVLAEDIPIDEELQDLPFPEPLNFETAKELYAKIKAGEELDDYTSLEEVTEETNSSEDIPKKDDQEVLHEKEVEIEKDDDEKVSQEDIDAALKVFKKVDQDINMLDLKKIASAIRQSKVDGKEIF